jgi:D-alanyl-D-alanine carboxypeptidase/D-alanyl-D-alanine-endopeptidase (penicillin-binding protein 4)
MLEWISWGLIGLGNIFAQPQHNLEPLELLAWQDTAIFSLPNRNPDPKTEKIIVNYLQNLASSGMNVNKQGVWIQSDWAELASNQGREPKSAASLTKIATTLAALGKWGANYQFETKIYSTGKIQKNGVLQGDLVIEGSGDPFFVWEEAIALGNGLQDLGIKKVQGNLVVTDRFYMNYQSNPQVTGELLKQALDRELWQREITQQHSLLPFKTPKPKIAIAKPVKTTQKIPANAQLLMGHQSLPLVEILRQMNIYSNNQMAQMLADLLGGAKNVAQYAATVAKVPPREIQLINGSGLGEENRISPRAVCQMLIEIDRLLISHDFDVMNLFPVTGKDFVGTIKDRPIPVGIALKTGTLDRVSALAGVVPTSDRGRIWFAILNNDGRYEEFRDRQDQLMQDLVSNWQLNPQGAEIIHKNNWHLGDPSRNLMNEP